MSFLKYHNCVNIWNVPFIINITWLLVAYTYLLLLLYFFPFVFLFSTSWYHVLVVRHFTNMFHTPRRSNELGRTEFRGWARMGLVCFLLWNSLTNNFDEIFEHWNFQFECTVLYFWCGHVSCSCFLANIQFHGCGGRKSFVRLIGYFIWLMWSRLQERDESGMILIYWSTSRFVI